jgi:hypothetical protein
MGVYRDKIIKWTFSGFHCWKIQANCLECPLYEIGMMHKTQGQALYKCEQPKANKMLLDLGKEPPKEWRDNEGWRKNA